MFWRQWHLLAISNRNLVADIKYVYQITNTPNSFKVDANKKSFVNRPIMLILCIWLKGKFIEKCLSAFRCHKLDTNREDASIMLRRGGTRRKMRLKVDAGFAMFFSPPSLRFRLECWLDLKGQEMSLWSHVVITPTTTLLHKYFCHRVVTLRKLRRG